MDGSLYQDNYTVSPPVYEINDSLAYWDTGNLEGEFDLRVIYTDQDPHDLLPCPSVPEIVTIILDNTTFKVDPREVVHETVKHRLWI